jgi:hypothetical protein
LPILPFALSSNSMIFVPPGNGHPVSLHAKCYPGKVRSRSRPLFALPIGHATHRLHLMSVRFQSSPVVGDAEGGGRSLGSGPIPTLILPSSAGHGGRVNKIPASQERFFPEWTRHLSGKKENLCIFGSVSRYNNSEQQYRVLVAGRIVT